MDYYQQQKLGKKINEIDMIKEEKNYLWKKISGINQQI